jgi:hypothetical protein
MHTNANDSMMWIEMIGEMMNSKSAMMMQEHQIMTMGNHRSMMIVLIDNPRIMQNLIFARMETAKKDTCMMSGMIRTVM